MEGKKVKKLTEILSRISKLSKSLIKTSDERRKKETGERMKRADIDI